jgi:hypothetical protein
MSNFLMILKTNLTIYLCYNEHETRVRSQLKEPKDLLIVNFLCTMSTLKIYHIEHLNDINIRFFTLCSFTHEVVIL